MVWSTNWKRQEENYKGIDISYSDKKTQNVQLFGMEGAAGLAISFFIPFKETLFLKFK